MVSEGRSNLGDLHVILLSQLLGRDFANWGLIHRIVKVSLTTIFVKAGVNTNHSAGKPGLVRKGSAPAQGRLPPTRGWAQAPHCSTCTDGTASVGNDPKAMASYLHVSMAEEGGEIREQESLPKATDCAVSALARNNAPDHTAVRLPFVWPDEPRFVP